VKNGPAPGAIGSRSTFWTSRQGSARQRPAAVSALNLDQPAETQIVEFSPTDKLAETLEVVTKSMEEMEAASS
jgi:hypothetical protein